MAGGVESIVHYKDGKLEHISSPILTFIKNILDKMVSNYGKDVVMKEYSEPVIKERNSSPNIVNLLESHKITLSSDFKEN